MVNADFESSNGKVSIYSDVIAKIAGYAATTSYGVVGMAYRSKKDTVANLLKRENVAKGIGVTVSADNKITIDVHVIIVYGVNINVIGKSIIKNVKYHVTHMTGLEVDHINVCVEGFRLQEQE